MKTKSEQAAETLLEAIVYYDLAERRGEVIADALIEELVSIAAGRSHPRRA